MKAFFKKLDRMAGQLLDTIDGDLQQPVMRIVTGEVFTHGANDHAARPDSQPAAAAASSDTPITPDAAPAADELPRVPALRPAGALQ